MTVTTFTDSVSDTLKVRNYTGVPGYGDLYVEEKGGRGYSFDLTPELRRGIADTLLEGEKIAHVLYGELPEVRISGDIRHRVYDCGSLRTDSSTTSQADYYLARARRYFAMGTAIQKQVEKDAQRVSEELAAAKALEERKDKLAHEFSYGAYPTYASLSLTSRKAIDAVITLEDR